MSMSGSVVDVQFVGVIRFQAAQIETSAAGSSRSKRCQCTSDPDMVS